MEHAHKEASIALSHVTQQLRHHESLLEGVISAQTASAGQVLTPLATPPSPASRAACVEDASQQTDVIEVGVVHIYEREVPKDTREAAQQTDVCRIEEHTLLEDREDPAAVQFAPGVCIAPIVQTFNNLLA